MKLISTLCLMMILLVAPRGSSRLASGHPPEGIPEMIGVLSGHKPMPDGTKLANRSSRENREKARQYLEYCIQGLGLEPQRQAYRMRNLNPLIDVLFAPYKGANVYTVLPATTQSQEYVVLGGHFDTERFCPGAIDNATGVALAYHVVKQLAALPQRDKHVILVLFDQEEEDLIGSQAFAHMLKDENYAVHSVHTFDTMGWDADGDWAVELELPTAALEGLYRKHGERLGIPIYATPVNSTDHHSFRELGFPVTGLTDEYYNGDYAPYKDTPDDTYETVNMAFVASCTELVYEALKDILTP